MKATIRRGFTLIELLVVISIISMLMAISLPSLGNARQQGERLHCMANMKNLTTAWIAYALDNDDDLCSADTDWNDKGGSHWVSDGPLLPTNYTGGTETAIKEGKLWLYTQTIKVYNCRSDPTELLRSYAISRTMSGKTCNCEGDNIKPYQKWSGIKGQPQKIVFADASSLSGWIEGSFCPVEDIEAEKPQWLRRDSRNITARHSNGTNLSYADGHCEYWKYQDQRTADIANWKLPTSQGSDGNVDLTHMVEFLKGR